MSQQLNAHQLDFDAIRRRAWRAATQDGLFELFTGVAFGCFAAYFLLDHLFDTEAFALWMIPSAVLPILFMVIRRGITAPRIGHVQMISEDLLKLSVALGVIAFLLGIAVFALTLADQDLSLIEAVFEHLALLLGIGFGAAALVMAYRFGLTRYYALGALSLISGPVAQALDVMALFNHPAPALKWSVYLLVMAAALLPTGLALLVRFLRENPVLAEEARDGAG